MRLFIALNFTNEVKSQINEIANEVNSNSFQGKFVNEEHMHLTVEFLGEIQENRLNLIKDIMEELEFERFALRLTKLGCFERREGNIYWIGIERNGTLFHIHRILHQSLIDKDFKLEGREYEPQITIGRKVKLRDGFNINELTETVKKIEITVNQVDLMKSEFRYGKLIHSVIYSRRLF